MVIIIASVFFLQQDSAQLDRLSAIIVSSPTILYILYTHNYTLIVYIYTYV